ncbi:MAG: phage holin family protein [Longicatena sp.]
MTQDLTNGYNALLGAVIAVLSVLFGEHWYLFALFLLLNVADWITGWMKARIMRKENSVKGWQGVLKKIGYWLMIIVSFAISAGFIEIGQTINLDLGITTLLGYFVLASLIVNEGRSIIENFVEAGFKVPGILVKGLAVADKLINKDEKEEEK